MTTKIEVFFKTRTAARNYAKEHNAKAIDNADKVIENEKPLSRWSVLVLKSEFTESPDIVGTIGDVEPEKDIQILTLAGTHRTINNPRTRKFKSPRNRDIVVNYKRVIQQAA